MKVQRRDFLLSGTMMAAAMAAAPSLAQTAAPAASAPGPGESRGGTAQAGDEAIQYTGGTEVKRLRIINTAELEVEAEKILPKGGYGYIFGGSGAEYTKRENLRAMEAIPIEPHFLSGVLKPDLTTEILGHRLPFPVIVPPMGSHGLAHVSKEIGTATAVNAVGTLMILSMQSNIPLEEVAKAHPGPKWMQLYFPADRGYAREVIMRAKAAGYSAIVPTIDSTLAYPRDNNIRNDFRIPVSLGKGNAPLGEKDIIKAAQIMASRKVDLNFDDMLWIKQETGLPVVSEKTEILRPARAGPLVQALHGTLEYVHDLGGCRVVIDVGEVAGQFCAGPLTGPDATNAEGKEPAKQFVSLLRKGELLARDEHDRGGEGQKGIQQRAVRVLTGLLDERTLDSIVQCHTPPRDDAQH
jgi:hypothetical protein